MTTSLTTLIDNLNREIAVRKQAEEAIKEAKAFTESTLNSIEDIFYACDLNGKLLSWNKALSRVTGYSDEELYSMAMTDFFVGEDIQRISNAVGKILKEGRSKQEADFVLKDRRQIPYEFTNSVLKDHQGNIIGFSGTGRDISERKRAEEKLSLFKKAVDSATDAIGMSTPQGIHYYQNEAFTKLFGLTAKQVDGKEGPPSTIYSDEKVGREVFATIMRGDPWTGEVKMLSAKDKSIKDIYLRAYSIKDKTGKVIGIVGIHTDITQRKLAEEKLRQAKEAAEAANTAKSQFLANMSHEIRTPMNGIIGMTELLLETELSADQRDYVATLYNSADSLLTVINDILDYSKLEAGKLIIDPIPFNLPAVVEETAKLFMNKSREKSIEFITRYAPETPENFIGDMYRIRQVLTNLINNSVKFTEKGHVLVNIECLEKNDSQASLRFCVEDTGIGIPADKLDQMFEHFTQADSSTTRRYGGTGLGLAICKQLIELMGGSISVESKVGAGSRFWFTLSLPLDKNSSEIEIPQEALDDVRILVVDDYEINRKILQEQLTSWDIRNSSCSSGREAIDMLRKAKEAGDPYQMAILDYQMPGMDGKELAREIKADADIAQTVLILLSSVAKKEDSNKIAEAGFAAYLVKPTGRSKLLNALTTIWSVWKKGLLSDLITAHTLSELQSTKKKSSQQKESFDNLHVLLAEDHLVNQKVAVKMLESLGCRVDIANNGKEAVEKIKNNAYHVVFMDCQMPVMDGYEATAEIRRREGTDKHSLIIALTAHAMQSDRKKCLDAGMDDYISKPVKRDALYQILAKYFNVKYSTMMSKPIKILLVEDDENLLHDIVRSFRKALPSVKCKTATNGVDACTLLGSYQPEIMIMDIKMPGMDGFEVIKYIRKNTRHSRLKIIAVTGLSPDDDRVRMVQEMGVDKMIYKPIEMQELITSVSNICAALGNNSCEINAENSPMETQPSTESLPAESLPINPAAEQAADSATFNPNQVLKILEGDTALLKEITEIFLSSSITDLQEMQQAISGRDAEQVSRQAHKIKGAAANVGAAALHKIALALEQSARTGDFAQIDRLFDSLKQELHKLEGIISKLDWSDISVGQSS